METKKKKTLEIMSVANLAVTFKYGTARTSVRLDRSKDIENFGICEPGIIIKKDDEFYLTIGGNANSDRVSIELVSLSNNDVSSLDIDLDSTQIKVFRYHTNEDEEKKIVGALRGKVWNRMYHVVKKLFWHECFYNDLFIMIGSKRSSSFAMMPLSKDKILEILSKPKPDPMNSCVPLHNDKTNWRIYWYVKDHYERFILKKKKAVKKIISNLTPVDIMRNRAVSSLCD